MLIFLGILWHSLTESHRDIRNYYIKKYFIGRTKNAVKRYTYQRPILIIINVPTEHYPLCSFKWATCPAYLNLRFICPAYLHLRFISLLVNSVFFSISILKTCALHPLPFFTSPKLAVSFLRHPTLWADFFILIIDIISV